MITSYGNNLEDMGNHSGAAPSDNEILTWDASTSTWGPEAVGLTPSITAGITASTTQTQGEGALTSDINEISTCANHKDTVTLPAASAAGVVKVINNGAKILKIFPASGDNLGKGVDTADYIDIGEIIEFVAIDATNWTAIKQPAPLTSYTPVTQGMGTLSNVNVQYQKTGDIMMITGIFTNGTVTASEAQVGLPSGWKVDSGMSSTSATPVGEFYQGQTTTGKGTALATPSDTYLNIGRYVGDAGINALLPVNGNVWTSNSLNIGFRVFVPVEAA